MFAADDVRAQGQGLRRLGDPAPPRARRTTGRSSGSACPASSAAWSSTPRSSPATTRRTSRSRRPCVEGYPSADELADAPTGRRCVPSGRRSPATPRTPSRSTTAARWHPRAADHLPRRRRGPAPGARRGGARPAVPRPAPSTWPRWRTAARGRRLQRRVLRLAAQPDPARPGPAPWARAGRPRGAATTATTGSMFRLAGARARPRRSSWTRRTSSATRPAGSGVGGCDAADDRLARRRRGASCCRATRLQPDTRHRFLVAERPAGRPTCGSTSTPTAAWPGCGCGASWSENARPGPRQATRFGRVGAERPRGYRRIDSIVGSEGLQHELLGHHLVHHRHLRVRRLPDGPVRDHRGPVPRPRGRRGVKAVWISA